MDHQTVTVCLIEIPIGRGATIDEVSLSALEIADRFRHQERRYPYPLTPDEAARCYALMTGSRKDTYTISDISGGGLFLADVETGTFYLADD